MRMSTESLTHRTLLPMVAVVCACIASPVLGARTPDDGGAFFEKRIRPLLIEHCVACHGSDPGAVKGGLRLDSPGALRQGGDGGPVVVPGDPEASPLYVAISYLDPEFQMPPGGRLSDQEREDVRRWIEAGAVVPRSADSEEPIRIDHPEGYDWDREREHWAYQPIATSPPPSVSDPAWCRNEIDQFILARLEQAGLAPAPEADKRVLIRRAYFDLIGLPPDPEAVNRYLADHSDSAFSRMVDELLESNQYGERWGRHWLDVARYADSNGLDENTAFGNAWRYRDWVVEAINADKPYDRFVLEQIAGDLLEDASEGSNRPSRLLATGFLALGPKVLAEPDKDKMQIDIVDEQLDVLGQAFLGQTIGCARCHDHKFDPITTADYHALAGILYSTRTMESLNTVARVHERALATDEQIEAARLHREASERNQAELAEVLETGSRELRARWLSRTSDVMLACLTLDSVPEFREAEDFDRSNLHVDFDRWGSGIGVIHTTRPDEIQFAEYEHQAVQAGRHELRVRYASDEERPLRVLVDGTLIDDEFCGESTGSFTPDGMGWAMVEFDLAPGPHVIRLERETAYPHLDRLFLIGPEDWARLDADIERIAVDQELDPVFIERMAFALESEPIFEPWRRVADLDSFDFDQECAPLLAKLSAEYAEDSVAADGVEDRSGVSPDDRLFLRSIVDGQAPLDQYEFARRWELAARMVLDGWERHVLKEAHRDGPLPDPGQESMRRVLVGDPGLFGIDESNPQMRATSVGQHLSRLLAERDELEAGAPGRFEMGIAVEDDDVIDLPIFIRGQHTNPSEEVVPRGVLQILAHAVDPPELSADSSGRLQLARWIVDPDNPLTSRVAVNRIWKGHFGRGIAANPSNFGTRGAEPTHPMLLDWLARRFVSGGWSTKAMHRLILDSATWRMGPMIDPETRELDPANALYSRRDPVRLEAEPVRDALLAVGGSLDLSVGGSLLNSGNFAYVTNDQSASNEQYDSTRRSIYLPVIRNDMYPFFSIFDYPDSSVPVDHRPRTVVAQQALFMMNSPLVLSQSEQLARELLENEALSDDPARVVRAYEACFARPPSPAELEYALSHLDSVRDSDSSGSSVQWPPGMDDADRISQELHALRSLCQVLFSSNEFIYVR